MENRHWSIALHDEGMENSIIVPYTIGANMMNRALEMASNYALHCDADIKIYDNKGNERMFIARGNKEFIR